MTEREFENILDKKITEAKLQIAEKRLQLLLSAAGAIILLFGILLPYMQLRISTDKVDEAIKEMKREVNQAIGSINRQPNLICSYQGAELKDDAILTIEGQNIDLTFELKNIGNEKSPKVSMRLYFNSEIIPAVHGDFYFTTGSDEPSYRYLYKYVGDISYLEAKDSERFTISFGKNRINEKAVPALLKIFYGAEQPKIYNISFQFN